ncbi:S8 family peptidase [Aldersonia kunmingensis]|uniref:S8 family peptidase n=1 Tax=Aldersonia kunmingensis TaxID=408066 RepID=UPI00082EAE4A|nr:S8 family serine peptidase [Aldersonia kunmingensis]
MIFDDDNTGVSPLGAGEQTTGRFVVVFAEGADFNTQARELRSVAGISEVASASELRSRAGGTDELSTSPATVFDRLRIAVVDADPRQTVALQAAQETDSPILSVEPELIHHPLAAPVLSQVWADSDAHAWGLAATAVLGSSVDGTGVKVAVLDTGFDLKHPDFAGRKITSRSFVPGEDVQDANGHGTHCIGTSCGAKQPQGVRRYGVAHAAEIFAGKVLSNSGSGSDANILAAIEWAIDNDCDVISMSLGADVRRKSMAYEAVGRRALDAGTLIIAAAGNNARRPGDPGFVGIPANSSTIMAVAAIDPTELVAAFSSGSSDVEGGQIDIAAPGVNVFSSWPLPKRHRAINGTSMATPHVSGIAALWCQQSGKRGRDLWTLLTQNARRLPLPSSDVGAGLVQAPR